MSGLLARFKHDVRRDRRVQRVDKNNKWKNRKDRDRCHSIHSEAKRRTFFPQNISCFSADYRADPGNPRRIPPSNPRPLLAPLLPRINATITTGSQEQKKLEAPFEERADVGWNRSVGAIYHAAVASIVLLVLRYESQREKHGTRRDEERRHLGGGAEREREKERGERGL